MASIHPIPKASIQSLTATQTLTTPPSLIKELLENSIDAHATHISIELSLNLLDIIQVRDNGHGILPGEDRVVLARRGWTSKIRTMAEVERGRVGTLGFRGEALAAAAEMAGGGLEIITRTEGEKVAWEGMFDRRGELVRQGHKSSPVGTTVKVVEFLKHLPVRRETAIKSTQKYLQQVRKLLVVYALSHANIRFSLKILPSPGKTKPTSAGEGNWVYSPSKTIPEAAMKIFGKDLVGHCTWVESKHAKVDIEAFVLKPGIDPTQITKPKQGSNLFPPVGHYIYVDSRPMACVRSGPFKSLLSLYKNYMRSSLAASGSTESRTLIDPFIFLNIRSNSLGLYDPNIEPAKDDVMFNNWEEDVLKVVDELFEGVYGKRTVGKGKETVAGESTGGRKVRNSGGGGEVDFSVLLARKPEKVLEKQTGQEERDPANLDVDMDDVEDPPPQPKHHSRKLTSTIPPSQQYNDEDTPLQLLPNDDDILEPTSPNSNSNTHTDTGPITESRTLRKRNPTWGYTMSANLIDDEDDEHLPSLPPTEKSKHTQQDDVEEAGSLRKDIHLNNPWVAAKMYSSTAHSSSSPRGPGGGGSEADNTTLSKTQPTQRPSHISISGGSGSGSRGYHGNHNFPYPGGPGGSGYKIYTTSRNTAKLNSIGAPSSSSPSPYGGYGNGGSSVRPQNGSLDRWISSGTSPAIQGGEGGGHNTGHGSPTGNRMGVGEGELRPAGFQTTSPERGTGFMTANAHFLGGLQTQRLNQSRPPVQPSRTPFHVDDDDDDEVELEREGDSGIATRLHNTSPQFGSINRPGGGSGGFTRSNTACEILRHPLRDDDDDDAGHIPMDIDAPSPESLHSRSPSPTGSSTAVKRRRIMERVKGKGKGKETMADKHPPPPPEKPVSSTYIMDSDDDGEDDDAPPSHNPPHPPPPPLIQKQKKFIPPAFITQPTSHPTNVAAPTTAPTTTTSPHKNRQKAATAALGMPLDSVLTALSSTPLTSSQLPPPNPNPNPPSPLQPKPPHARPRTKSHRRLLPLESVPPGERINDVLVTIHLPTRPTDTLQRLHILTRRWDGGGSREYFSRREAAWGVPLGGLREGKGAAGVLGGMLLGRLGGGGGGVPGWRWDEEGEGEGEGVMVLRAEG